MRKFIFFVIGLLFFSGLAYSNVPRERNLEFDYEVVLKDIPRDAAQLKVWIPLLPENDYQIIEAMTIHPSESAVISQDKTYQNKILHYTFEPPFDKNYKINVKYKIRRLEYSNKSGEGDNGFKKADIDEDVRIFLKANQLVTLSPKVKKVAGEITEGKKSTIEKARAIYDYVMNNVSYDKTIAGWGNGDTERVCNIKAGNCTDFHSLFISLSRASGIPAKFIIGVPFEESEGETAKYHCWAEFYDEQLGWIPVDISEAWKDKSKYEYHFGALDENRLEFTQGRDIMLEPNHEGEPLNYFVYPYAEVDGEIFKGIGVLFRYQAADLASDIRRDVDYLTKQ